MDYNLLPKNFCITIINPEDSTATALFEQALKEIQEAVFIAVDIETRPDLSISSTALTTYPGLKTWAVALPYRLSVDIYEYAYSWIQKLLDTGTGICGQGFMYDIAYLMRYGIVPRNYLWDTAIAHHCWYAELPKDLGTLAAFYIRDSIFWKNEGNTGDLQDLYIYNGLDTHHTALVMAQWFREAPAWAKNNYLIEFPLVFPSILMEATGIRVDEEKFLATKKEKQEALQKELEELQYITACPTFNPGSSHQVKPLLKILGCQHVTSTDEKSLKKYAYKHPFTHYIVERILNYRESAKLISTYLQENKLFNGRMLYSLKPYGTKTGRLSSKGHHFWTGCMPANIAEAYTPNGWVKIENKPPIIAQYNLDTRVLEFVEATWNEYLYEGALLSYEGRCIAGDFTHNHTIYSKKLDRPWRKTTALSSCHIKQLRVPTSGDLITDSPITNVTDKWIRMLVMLSADGSLERKNTWRISLSKQRKIDRLFEIMGDTYIVENAHSNGRRFVIRDDGFTKIFPNWLVNLPLRQRQLFITELQYWDGHSRNTKNNSFIYYTTIKENAELVQTLCHISNMSASISIKNNNRLGTWGSGNNKDIYTVFINYNSFGTIKAERWKDFNFKGVVSCPTVNAGAWLVRYNRNIHITGNSNIQNVPRDSLEIKACYIADPDYDMVEIDYCQAESRDTGYISGDTVLIDAVTGTKDFHSFNGSSFFGVPYEAICQTTIDETGKPKHKILDKELRQLAKPINHGKSYGMGSSVLVDTMGLEKIYLAGKRLALPVYYSALDIATHLGKAFAKTYPILTGAYVQYIISRIVSTRMLVGATGWTRYCFGNPDKNKADLNAYIAHPSQSLNAMTLNKAIMNIFRNVWLKHPLELMLLAQIHDSIFFQAKKGDNQNAIIEAVNKEMYIPINVTDIFNITREMIVPTDVSKVSPSWAECKAD